MLPKHTNGLEMTFGIFEKHLPIPKLFSTRFIVFKDGPFPATFFFIFVFSIQLTVSKCSINFADDWIRTADLWYWKRPRYQLSHTTTAHPIHCLTGTNHSSLTFLLVLNGSSSTIVALSKSYLNPADTPRMDWSQTRTLMAKVWWAQIWLCMITTWDKTLEYLFCHFIKA